MLGGDPDPIKGFPYYLSKCDMNWTCPRTAAFSPHVLIPMRMSHEMALLCESVGLGLARTSHQGPR